MYTIVDYKHLGGLTHEMSVEAPQLAKKAQAGQFLIIRINEEGERVPLTIADSDAEKGTITIVFQAVGRSTDELAQLRTGDQLADVVGPLGRASEIEKYGTVVIVGGGVGIAPIYPIAKSLKAAGNHVISIIGAKNKDLLFWEDKMDSVSDELHIATDDGSVGHKGFVTDILEEVCSKGDVAAVWAVGPMIMMKNCARVTKPFGVKTFVSMNPVMIDGTGMCGGCRIQVGADTKFACVDGPEFDGHQVDFDLAMKRSAYLKNLEAEGRQFYHDHQCNLGLEHDDRPVKGV
ncbi:sulfide/dihydroorotate dehydrogenase-like FAD/NAD-binding protein [Peptococcus simiae]|uniref:Sulfide/dihydroorotate dehydrogenase-like FAD/NAD-binding protein n=1 Tax=Peptococcus simiae TaxID=1643805 RepID=A0ABW9GWM5_9FIRM